MWGGYTYLCSLYLSASNHPCPDCPHCLLKEANIFQGSDLKWQVGCRGGWQWCPVFHILVPSWPWVFGVGQWHLGFQHLMACWLYFPYCILNFITIPFTPQCWSQGCFLFTSWLMDCTRIDVVLLQIVLGCSLSVSKVMRRHPQLVIPVSP